MIDRSQPADNQSVDQWWRTLETWSKNEHGTIIPTTMTTQPSDEWTRKNFPELCRQPSDA